MPENPESEGSRLITLKQIELEHGVSRSALHTYRRSASFPQPVPVEGSTKTQYRAAEVAAWFDANPKQQGKKRSQFVSHEQGDPVTTTTARDRLLETLTSPGLVGLDAEDAAGLVDAHRSAVVAEVVAALTARAGELSVEAEQEMRRDLEERAQVWHEAADAARRLKCVKQEASNG